MLLARNSSWLLVHKLRQLLLGRARPRAAGRVREVLVREPADLLVRAYAETTDIATDDAGLVERLGERVHTIAGEPLAFKITTPFDLLLAQALVAQEQNV